MGTGGGQGYSRASPHFPRTVFLQNFGSFLLIILNLPGLKQTPWLQVEMFSAGPRGSAALLCQVKGQGSVSPWCPPALREAFGHSGSLQLSGSSGFALCGTHSLKYREMLGFCFRQHGRKMSLTFKFL